MLAALDDFSTLNFKYISTCQLATERIVVDLQSRPHITNKSVTQVLHRDNRHGPWLLAGNMTEEVVKELATATEGFSQIWKSRSYSTFGESKSAKPASTTSTATASVLAPQKFVTASQAQDISKWNENTADSIDPNDIAVEVPFETVPLAGRQRLVREDSDDDEEDSEEEAIEAQAPPATMRVPVLDSDDGGADDEAPAPPATKRAPLPDSDDEVEQIVFPAPAAQRHSEEDIRDDGHNDEPLGPMLAAVQTRAMPQPTWTSNPFSLIAEEEEQREHSSEPQSPILEMYQSSHHSSPPRTPHLSPHLSFQASSSPPYRQSSTRSPDLLGSQSSVTQRCEHTGQLETLMPPPKFPSRDEFDANKDGRASRGVYSNQGMQPPSGSMAPPAQGRGRGRSDSSRARPSFRARGAGGNQPSFIHTDLVQLSCGTSTENIRPPPGLEIRANHRESASYSGDLDLLDRPLDNLQVPSIKPLPAESRQTSEPRSASIRRSSNMSSANSGASYVNRYNPPRDLAKIENTQLAKLYAMQKETEEAKAKSKLEKETAENLQTETKESSQPTESCSGAQRRQKDDERSSCRVHSTMRQQTPKPGKKGKQTASKLTGKERKQRLDDVLGEIPPKMMPSKATSNTSIETMSARKKQALEKNPGIDPAAASDLVASQLSSRQTANLIQCIEPLFAAGRAFPGQLKFEIQIGQALIANSKLVTEGDVQLFNIKHWEKMFGPSTQQPVATAFTNIVTRNGHDVDRLLKMKPLRETDGPGPAKLFDELEPGPSGISYEFHCQSKECEEFWIVVDGTGAYNVRKSTYTLGTVNLHYPANIWDARAILHGTADLCEPEEETEMIVESFVQSIYVPSQGSASITYRQPAENDMTVRSVTVKRTSLHDCNATDGQDIQLQVVEVKELFNRFHGRDKKLTQAFEKSYSEMFEHDRIHYEFSLVHNSIDAMLKQNLTLQTGDLTDAVTGKQVLKPHTIQPMLNTVSHIVSKIDWVGINNNGTLLRVMQKEHEKSARIASTIPGAHPPPSFVGTTSTAAGGGPALRSDVPGIRTNTKAEIGFDADRKPVLIGMGGAMIPLPAVEEEFDIPASELAPNDSASNIGAPSFPTYIPSAAFARGLTARGPNFW